MAGAPRIVCPICGAPLPGAIDVCPSCGTPLPQRALRAYLKALGVDLDAASPTPRSEEGTVDSKTAVSCSMCGARLPPSAAACPICGTETGVAPTLPEPTTVLCVFCGATAMEGEELCESCGAVLRAPEEGLSTSARAPAQSETSPDEDLDEHLDVLIAKLLEQEAMAPRETAATPRRARAAVLPSQRARPTESAHQWDIHRIRTLAFLATVASLVPVVYASHSGSEVGRWAAVALMGSLLSTGLTLAFLEAHRFRIDIVRFAATVAGGGLLVSVPVRSALEPSSLPILDAAILAAGLGLIAWMSYGIRGPPDTYMAWLAALPGAFVQTVVAAAHSVTAPAASSAATWVAIGLTMGLTGVLELRMRWGDLRVAVAVQRARKRVTEQGLRGSLTVLDRAAHISDRPDVPWTVKGATLVLLGRYREAIESIDVALRVNPRNEVAWVNKGNALARMDRHMDALKCYNSAIRVNPGYEVAWNNKGNTLARAGRLTDALTCYDRALEIDPEYRSAWWNRGYVYATLGDNVNAVRCADAVLRLSRRIPAAAA